MKSLVDFINESNASKYFIKEFNDAINDLKKKNAV